MTYDIFNFSEPFGSYVFVGIKSPLQNVDIYFSEFYQQIIDQSDSYSNHCDKHLNLSIIEFKAFSGILGIMGFHKLSNVCLYWSADEIFYNSRISNIMTEKWFCNILRYLRLNDNSVMPLRPGCAFDKLYEILPMIGYLNDTFASSFFPDRMANEAK